MSGTWVNMIPGKIFNGLIEKSFKYHSKKIGSISLSSVS